LIYPHIFWVQLLTVDRSVHWYPLCFLITVPRHAYSLADKGTASPSHISLLRWTPGSRSAPRLGAILLCNFPFGGWPDDLVAVSFSRSCYRYLPIAFLSLYISLSF
jgi:hypothetical protein